MVPNLLNIMAPDVPKDAGLWILVYAYCKGTAERIQFGIPSDDPKFFISGVRQYLS